MSEKGDADRAIVVASTMMVDDDWNESTITWSNRPALGAPLASAAHGGIGDWIEFDVTGAVEVSDDLEMEAEKAATALEEEYSKERLVALVKSGGKEE